MSAVTIKSSPAASSPGASSPDAASPESAGIEPLGSSRPEPEQAGSDRERTGLDPEQAGLDPEQAGPEDEAWTEKADPQQARPDQIRTARPGWVDDPGRGADDPDWGADEPSRGADEPGRAGEPAPLHGLSPADAAPARARGVAEVGPAPHQQGQEDLTMLLAVYRQTLAAAGGDPVRAFDLTEAMLHAEIDHEQAVRALAAAAVRLAGLEAKVVRLLLELAEGE